MFRVFLLHSNYSSELMFRIIYCTGTVHLNGHVQGIYYCTGTVLLNWRVQGSVSKNDTYSSLFILWRITYTFLRLSCKSRRSILCAVVLCYIILSNEAKQSLFIPINQGVPDDVEFGWRWFCNLSSPLFMRVLIIAFANVLMFLSVKARTPLVVWISKLPG